MAVGVWCVWCVCVGVATNSINLIQTNIVDSFHTLQKKKVSTGNITPDNFSEMYVESNEFQEAESHTQACV